MGTELELASWRRVTSELYAAAHVRACDPFGEDLGGPAGRRARRGGLTGTRHLAVWIEDRVIFS